MSVLQFTFVKIVHKIRLNLIKLIGFYFHLFAPMNAYIFSKKKERIKEKIEKKNLMNCSLLMLITTLI